MRDEVLNTANSRQTKGFRNAIPCLCRRAERRNETEEKVFDLKLWLVNKKNNKKQSEPPPSFASFFMQKLMQLL